MIWVVAAMLVFLAGLSAPLAALTLSIAALNGVITLRPGQEWIGSLWCFAATFVLLIGQILADLFFIPITVKDRAYLRPARTQNNYLHARAQSLFRPMVAAVLIAALPLPIPDWTAAVLGFCGAVAVYWLSAWIREHIAINRGALLLVLLETLKNIVLLALAAMTFWLPPLALALMLLSILPLVVWTWKLQREHWMYASYGGQRAGEDS